MARSHFRGHPTVYEKGEWRYEDTKEPLPVNAGEIRPCILCGKIFPEDMADPCLGKLPGVKSACCGHGIQDRAFIRFENGIEVRGFAVTIRKDEACQTSS